MAVKNETSQPETQPEVEEAPVVTELTSGFHVTHEGVSLGCYPTAEDAEAFADGHPRANGLTVAVEEVKA